MSTSDHSPKGCTSHAECRFAEVAVGLGENLLVLSLMVKMKVVRPTTLDRITAVMERFHAEVKGEMESLGQESAMGAGDVAPRSPAAATEATAAAIRKMGISGGV